MTDILGKYCNFCLQTFQHRHSMCRSAISEERVIKHHVGRFRNIKSQEPLLGFIFSLRFCPACNKADLLCKSWLHGKEVREASRWGLKSQAHQSSHPASLLSSSVGESLTTLVQYGWKICSTVCHPTPFTDWWEHPAEDKEDALTGRKRAGDRGAFRVPHVWQFPPL